MCEHRHADLLGPGGGMRNAVVLLHLKINKKERKKEK